MKVAFVSQPRNTLLTSAQYESFTGFTYQVATRLAADGHQAIAYARRFRGQSRLEEHRGVTYRRVSALPDRALHRLVEGRLRPRPDRPFFASALHHPVYAAEIALDGRLRGVDVFHLFNYSQFAPVIRTLHRRARVILNMGCDWLSSLDPELVRPRLAASDWILTDSEYLTELTRRAHPDAAARCATLPRGVDVERFDLPPGGRRPSLEDRPRILFVGRVSPEKGVHVLIEAFTKVLGDHPGASLRLVGPQRTSGFIVGLSEDPTVRALAPLFEAGAYDAKLRALLPARGDVEFVGPVPNAELPREYHGADVLVAPSVWEEPFGIPLVEAMATGLPVIASGAGGMKDIVDDGVTGLLVERGDATGLADAILRILADSDLRLRMGAAARRRAVDHYSFERIVDQLIPYYSGDVRAIDVA